MVKVTYKHWKKPDVTLEVVGTMPSKVNSNLSDRFIIITEDGTYEDIIKTTVISIEEISE